MMFTITDADIKVAAAANEMNTVTLYVKLRSAVGLKGFVGRMELELSDVGLARELFDAARNGTLGVGAVEQLII